LAEVGLQPEVGEVGACDVELARLDVDAVECDTREGFAEDPEDGTDPAPDLEQTRSGASLVPARINSSRQCSA
jgi:hypothetical protein